MNKMEEAQYLFDKGYSCAQAVLTTFANEHNIDHEVALKIASGLGAGLGFRGNICGAVLGAYIVIGLSEGSHLVNDEYSNEVVYNLTRRFDKEFIKMHSTTNCKELLQVDLSKPEGIDYAVQTDLFKTKCPIFIGDAVSILEKML